MSQTRPQALILAHGAPSDPAPLEAALQALAARTAAHLPGWAVQGATLAAPGALEDALTQMPGAVILPFFMAEGWFTRKVLPERLAAAGLSAQILPAFGVAPALPALLAAGARGAAQAAGLVPAATTLLLIAHGSQKARASAEITEEIAADLRASAGFAAVTCGFIEEKPFAKDAARIRGPALCLPLLATRAGHYSADLPQALAEAGFTGPLLPPLAEWPAIPAFLAACLTTGG